MPLPTGMHAREIETLGFVAALPYNTPGLSIWILFQKLKYDRHVAKEELEQ